MGTKIDWCDEVWNPTTGCSPVSEACQNCYAKRFANRLRGRFGYPSENPFQAIYHPNRIAKPFKWKAPRRIFVNSMGDLFHPDIDWNDINRILVIAENLPQHTFMILTKRPRIMAAYFKSVERRGIFRRPLKNVWLGVTAETQRWFDERVEVLMNIDATVRFVSIEPILSAIDIEYYSDDLDWIIAGPETGTGKRPFNPAWIESIYKQCFYAGIPFFDKRKDQYFAKDFPK